MRLLHVNAAKRGLDHTMLSDVGCEAYKVASLSDLTAVQLKDFIQRVCVHKPVIATPKASGQAGGRRQAGTSQRPRGRVRPDGAVWLATPRQRRFIVTLLERSYSDRTNPVPPAFALAKRVLGESLAAEAEPADLAAIAAAVTTGKAAGQLINVLIGALKRSGKWNE